MIKEILKKLWEEDGNDKVVTALYRMGLSVFVPLIILFFFLRTDFAVRLLIKDEVTCFFRRSTGLYCPGCGGTRAAISLARLNIIKSFRLNCIVPTGVMMYLYFMVKESMHRLFGTRKTTERELVILVAVYAAMSLTRCLILNLMWLGII